MTIFLVAIISTLPKSTELNNQNSQTHTVHPTKPHSLSLTSISIREIYILLLFWMFYIILRSGDVEIQPGPLSSCSSVFSDEMSESDIDKFSFVHYNIQSIKNKVDLLSIELRAFDIISLTETWLNDESEVPETLFENFKHPYTYIRTNQVGGGISVYVKNSIFSTRRPDLEVRTTRVRLDRVKN